jgi:hypothetical protein
MLSTLNKGHTIFIEQPGHSHGSLGTFALSQHRLPRSDRDSLQTMVAQHASAVGRDSGRSRARVV